MAEGKATELLQLRGIRTVGAMFAQSGKPRDGVDCKKQGFLTCDSNPSSPAKSYLVNLLILRVKYCSIRIMHERAKVEKYTRDGKIGEIEKMIDWLTDDDHFMSRGLDGLDPTIRPRSIELRQRELGAVQALAPDSTDEEIRLICLPFENEISTLNPGKPIES